jgi:outer membrane protein TolC
LRTRENILRNKSLLVSAEGSFINESARIAFLRAGRAVPLDQAPKQRPQLELNLGGFNELAVNSPNAAVRDLRLVAKLKLLRKQQELQLGVAKNEHLPSLDLVGSAKSKGWAPNHGGNYDGLDKQDYSVLLNLEYPFGAEQARGDEGKARAGLEEIDSSLAAAERDLVLGLRHLAQNIQDQEAILRLNQEQEDSAAEKLRLDERNYRIGRLDTFYLIDSTNNLNTARLQRLQTLIQLQRLHLSYLALSDQLLARFPDLAVRLTNSRKGD